jgi:hypothetical protein
MQKNLQTVSVVVSQTQNDADASHTLSAPVELDLTQLQQVGGGLGPNGTWAAVVVEGPNGTW